MELDGEIYYKIAHSQSLPPFLMTVPSDSDLWMFIASGGGLTAGRLDPDGSLFPYLSVDQLHDAHHHTGPITLIRLHRTNGDRVLWEPFAPTGVDDPAVERNLYKSSVGNRLIFEEIHSEFDLVFRYRWSAADELGWVRTATLVNRGQEAVSLELLDGLRNINPFGAPLGLQQQASNLVDAYKHSEVDFRTGLGIFSLTSTITDRPEALEILRANVVWSCGLPDHGVHLSPASLRNFRRAEPLPELSTLRGARGNYFLSASLEIEPESSRRWHLVGDTRLDHVELNELRRTLREESNLETHVEAELQAATEALARNVASADGLQITNHAEAWSHHFANVLFNNMRGGVFFRNHDVPVDDFIDFLRERNEAVADGNRGALARLGEKSTVDEVQTLARSSEDRDFERLSYEYLPLWFGRRHGDPSRPWNHFAIRVRDRVGERVLCYQGNWRDIFQNWEALAASFPGFLPSMVAKFVNASTVDGFNPYRVTRAGVEWEAVSPEDPWSNFGYWGDHQIVYLLKLLEAMDRHDPSAFASMLSRELFSYANVPYRIAPYAEICRDPRATIAFDERLDDDISLRVEKMGTDGRLLLGPGGSVYHANLLEKLLVPLLSKISNLVPGGGIWLNTQRPEWNDANNALAGPGLSVVTLCYLRRYLEFLTARFEPLGGFALPVSSEIVAWFDRITEALDRSLQQTAADGFDDDSRREFMDRAGEAFSSYRESVYTDGFSGKFELSLHLVYDFCRLALEMVERSIEANRREDGLFHTYNLLRLTEDGRAAISHLHEMLEGQVAVLSSGLLNQQEALELLRTLYDSRLYSPNHRSFLLYPNLQLPGFLERNVIPESTVEEIPLLMDLLAAGNREVLDRDAEGICRFHGDFQSAADVAAVLEDLAESGEWSDAVARDASAVLEAFEELFQHDAFTGRSGVMYGYEGLGCVYWHMVAKLLLAVQENVLQAERHGASREVRKGLAQMYYRVRSGIGYEKSVGEYGAFPTDPYSHTPAAGGAKQPGMTGQVKEEILTRWGELGVRVEAGSVQFEPTLLRRSELLGRAEAFRYFSIAGESRSIALPAGTLAFTYCQVPVVYTAVDGEPRIEISFADGSAESVEGSSLGADLSAQLFARDGWIERIEVAVPAKQLIDI